MTDVLNLAIAFFLVILPCTIIALYKHTNSSSHTTLPPSPPTLPFFGNLLNLGPKPHLSLAKLATTHGPLMTLKLGRVTTIVISSSKLAKEVLQKNDTSFSNRTIIDAVKAINHHKNSLVWLPVGPKWRHLRKMCNTHVFSSARLDASQGLRKIKVQDMISYVEKCREGGFTVDIGQLAFNTTLNLLSTTFFSVDLVDNDINSKLAREFKDTVRGIMKEAGKPNLADYFPGLRWMDPQGIRRRMSVHFRKMVDVFDGMIEKRLRGERPPGLVHGSHDVLDALLGINLDKVDGVIEPSHIPYLLLDLFSAGTDTTSSTMEWAMAELLHNREKLQKAKAELNEIVGKGNTLQESHIGNLPYLQAILKETFRLHPAVPFLVPKKAEKNVTISGFTVPKDAQILVNVWAIGRDPEIWDQPESFKPERFLGSDIDVKGCDFELIPFGAGRRICVGLPLAIRNIHLMLGSLVHGFEWELEGGGLGPEMDMEENFAFTLEKAQPLRAVPVHF